MQIGNRLYEALAAAGNLTLSLRATELLLRSNDADVNVLLGSLLCRYRDMF